MRLVSGLILCILSILLILFAFIGQQIVIYQQLGIILFGEMLIPHWTAWFYLGVIPGIIGYFILRY